MTQSIELPLEMRLRAADQSMAPKYYIVKRAIIRKIEKEEYKENDQRTSFTYGQKQKES